MLPLWLNDFPMSVAPTQILTKHQLRKTTCRNEVLAIFIDHAGQGLSENFVEELVTGDFDRATIYRTINTFMDKGIIHRILDEDNVVKFALCADECETGHHQHEHIHFKCTKCDTTTCLDDVSVVDLQLPSGYVKAEANYLIVGTCANCNG
jgi:Fur family ferric uptake transcriptional regulator